MDVVSQNALARETLDEGLGSIEGLLSLDAPAEHRDSFRRMLYANAIAALETFLSDTFINAVRKDDALLQRYVDSDPRFSDKKVPFRDVRREAERFEKEAQRELLDIVWHNIAKVKAMYRDVLDIDLGDLTDVANAIQARHHIVHRNGRDKQGAWIEITHGDITDLLRAITAVASRVELKLDHGMDGSDLVDDEF